MKKTNIFKSMLILSFSILLINSGCKKDKEPAPEIPPASTFEMSFSDFNNSTKAVMDSTTQANWTFAATNVAVWNVIIAVNLAIPVAAFRESFNHQGEYQNDGSWTWTYTYPVVGVNYTAKLNAKKDGDYINWNMYISKQGAYTDFLWYTGRSKIGNTEGTWTLYQNPTTPNEYVDIVWHRNATAGTSDIKYTNVIPGGAENGGYITYGIDPAQSFDAFYDIYNKGADNLTNITWNRTNKNGKVKDPNHFGDSEWHCWDVNLNDTTCN